MDNFKKVNDNFEVTIANNGYMIDVSGRNHEDDWVRNKIVCTDLEQLLDTITTIVAMEIDR